jgi:hypothetical protein
MNPLPVTPAHRLAERAEQQRWLVSGLWSEQAVGIIGGETSCWRVRAMVARLVSRALAI